ncbi:hypothetical protein [Brevibacillus porteri]|uniref:hypothetical protein n=1 Tax=Brevibacillus porteri TaxID=2126350 RepID=UPI003D23B139
MKWRKWLENWDMTSLKIKTPFLEMDWNPQEKDKDAAWSLYIELLTRTTTQRLTEKQGSEQTALDNIYSLFQLTRDIIKHNGRDCIEFTKIAVVVLNQVIRPFTTKWHKMSLQTNFADEEVANEFRRELSELQDTLIIYTKMLAEMAGVEDLTELS